MYISEMTAREMMNVPRPPNEYPRLNPKNSPLQRRNKNINHDDEV